MHEYPIFPSAYILHVILIVHGLFLVAIDVQEELAGDVHHLAVAVLVLSRQNSHGADTERMAHGGAAAAARAGLGSCGNPRTLPGGAVRAC